MAPKRQATRKKTVKEVVVDKPKRRGKLLDTVVENVEKSSDENDDLVDISPVDSSNEVSDSESRPISKKLLVKIPAKPVKVLLKAKGQGTSKIKKGAKHPL